MDLRRLSFSCNAGDRTQGPEVVEELRRCISEEDGVMSREVLEPVTHSLQHGGLCPEDVSDG